MRRDHCHVLVSVWQHPPLIKDFKYGFSKRSFLDLDGKLNPPSQANLQALQSLECMVVTAYEFSPAPSSRPRAQ